MSRTGRWKLYRIGDKLRPASGSQCVQTQTRSIIPGGIYQLRMQSGLKSPTCLNNHQPARRRLGHACHVNGNRSKNIQLVSQTLLKPGFIRRDAAARSSVDGEVQECKQSDHHRQGHDKRHRDYLCRALEATIGGALLPQSSSKLDMALFPHAGQMALTAAATIDLRTSWLRLQLRKSAIATKSLAGKGWTRETIRRRPVVYF